MNEKVFLTENGCLFYIASNEDGYEFTLYDEDGALVDAGIMTDRLNDDDISYGIASDCLYMIDEDDEITEETEMTFRDIEELPEFCDDVEMI